MKKSVMKRITLLFCMTAALVLLPAEETAAKSDNTIKDGIYIDDISLSGMTAVEAKEAVDAYVESLRQVEITLLVTEENSVTVTAGDLGISWSNPEIVEDAAQLGTQGNIVQRYKALKDLEKENKIYRLELDFDIVAINRILSDDCKQYDTTAVDMGLTLKDGVFSVQEGQTGYTLDIEDSIDIIYGYLAEEWNHEACTIALDVEISEPRGSEEELLQVKDLLGSFTTSYATSNSNRSANIANGCELINGTLLYPGDEFSTCDTVTPFTAANGYYMAGSYLNGKVVDSLGGGICQVSTTLYNAVLLSELEVTERYNHSMIVTYVRPSADAAISDSSGKDFRFVNNTDYPIYIEGYTTSKKEVTFNIYGVETRSEGRTVEYVGEVLETVRPESDTIYPDASHPIGYIGNVEGAHIGYKARLWKIVKEDGVEVSREVINTSSYKMVPRSAVVGVSTPDPNAYNEIMAAIGTGSIDHVRNVIAILTAPPAAPEAPAQ